ncbi:hypothetical protein PTKU46_40910 [Paraburkholderia terrae]
MDRQSNAAQCDEDRKRGEDDSQLHAHHDVLLEMALSGTNKRGPSVGTRRERIPIYDHCTSVPEGKRNTRRASSCKMDRHESAQTDRLPGWRSLTAQLSSGMRCCSAKATTHSIRLHETARRMHNIGDMQ